MKNFIIVLFLIVFSKVTSQNSEKSILLKDEVTNLPIEDATVLILKTKQNLLSNSEGIVSFVLKSASSIQISHTSYVTQTIRSSLLKDNTTIIYLKNNINKLEEIILTKQHPQKILANLIDNSTKKLVIPARLKVYSREFFKLNGNYSYYNDGLMNFQISGKPKNFETKILVEQNRSFGLIDENIAADLLGYNLNNIMGNYYSFKYLLPLLEPKAKKEYAFLVKAYSNNDNYYLMTATPLENSKGLLDDFSIIYDKNQKIIIEVSSHISPVTFARVKEKTSIGSRNIYKSNFKTIYKLDGSNYFLLSSKEEIGFDKVLKNKQTDFEVRNYFVTTNFSNQNYSYKENEVFKDKTLFNKKNEILTQYWNISGLTMSEEEQKIIEGIEDRLHE